MGCGRYQLFKQFVERLPIPELTASQESTLSELAEKITGIAQQRYQLHEDMRATLLADYGGGATDISTRVALYRWWELDDDGELNTELQRRFKSEIPLNKRSEWRRFLSEQQAVHQSLTDEIIQHEIALNDVVYTAFNLDAAERQLIEETTKYPYGEV